MTDLSVLNEKQLEAVVSDAKRMLILAGAGSGKTKTLIQKVLHLISEKHVKPSNILAITFTKNAANEMIDRLIISDPANGDYEGWMNDKAISKAAKDAFRLSRKSNIPWINKLTVRTFHSLCYTILRNSLSPDVFDGAFRIITDEIPDDDASAGHSTVALERPKEIMDKVLLNACKDSTYLLKLKRYILDYLVDKRHIEANKPLTHKNDVSYTTLRGEKVKSKSERDIADWLYRHRIDYEYEKQITIRDFVFKPDFYLPQANLYLEHVTEKSYPTKDKELQFKLAGIVCERTYEYMMHDSDLFNKEMEQIISGRIDLALNTNVTLNFDEEFKGYRDKVKDFVHKVIQIHDLVKLESIEAADLLQKSSKSQHERIRMFYELAVPLITGYRDYCANKSYLDFDDLIIKTIALLEKKPEVREQYQKQFQYILVDEFQDVNNQQVRLLNLLLTPASQLFCVGDDWQSIYGFRGSEVKYIVNFEEHFDNPQIIKLNVNYRSSDTIVGASNEVIKRNIHQVPKEVVAFKKGASHLQIYRAKDIRVDGVSFLVDKARELHEKGLTPDDILVLYRRTSMFYPYYKDALKAAGVNVSAKTIHAAKGLEAKAVFILGLTEGSGGFPEVWGADSLSKIVKEVKHDMQLEEERRLFYVALTRAKDELFLITELGSESQFIDEIPKDFYQLKTAQLSQVNMQSAICAACGTEIKHFYKFCPSCGEKTTE
ncbi:MAG: ATP-dependent helicase [Chitinophagaceae bacterium]|nr:MAG: ATP-dependent helicase [Chitinophagaceae bacterium]